jgi:Na+/pantothenate symporter
VSPPPLPVRKRFPWIPYWIVLVLIVLFAFAPVGSVILCGLIANTYGCKVDEGSVHPCIIDGHDYGQLLYTLGVLGWLMLVTLPGGAFALVTWLIVLVLHHANWRKRAATNL